MNTLNIVMCVDTPVFPLKPNLDLLISCQCTNLLHATCWLSKKNMVRITLFQKNKLELSLCLTSRQDVC